MKRKGFKSFVLKVCETKGFTDVFLGKCVKLKSLGGILASFEGSPSIFGTKAVFLSAGPGLNSFRATRGNVLAASGDYDKANYTTGDYRLSRSDLGPLR